MRTILETILSISNSSGASEMKDLPTPTSNPTSNKNIKNSSFETKILMCSYSEARGHPSAEDVQKGSVVLSGEWGFEEL